MQDAKIDNHGLVVRRLNSRIETSDFSCQAQRQNDKIKERFDFFLVITTAGPLGPIVLRRI
jgi:hypothetical protein